MAREILFRGKRVIDGKWAESCCPLGEMHSGTVTYDFDSKTVCQYTGYADMRKKKVFENDIVFYEDGGCYGHIVFKEGQFLIEWQESRPDLRSDIHFWFTKRRLYIVGNVFDNPELLKEDDAE